MIAGPCNPYIYNQVGHNVHCFAYMKASNVWKMNMLWLQKKKATNNMVTFQVCNEGLYKGSMGAAVVSLLSTLSHI